MDGEIQLQKGRTLTKDSNSVGVVSIYASLKAVGDNYSDTETTTGQVEITVEAKPIILEEFNSTLVLDESLVLEHDVTKHTFDPKLSGIPSDTIQKWTWKNTSKTLVSDAKVGKYTVNPVEATTYTVELSLQKDGYKDYKTTKSIVVTIKPEPIKDDFTPTLTLEDKVTLPFGTKDYKLTPKLTNIPEGTTQKWTWDDANQLLVQDAPTGDYTLTLDGEATTYTVRLTLHKDGYNDYSESKSITIDFEDEIVVDPEPELDPEVE